MSFLTREIHKPGIQKKEDSFMKRNLSMGVIMLAILVGCTPPDSQPRFEHEAEKTWTPVSTPRVTTANEDLFNSFNLEAIQTYLESNQTLSGKDLDEKVIQPLSQFVLNGSYMEVPIFRTSRLTSMIRAFNHALQKILDESPSTVSQERIDELKDLFYKVTFSGCTRDLRSDCVNVSEFRNDARSGKIMLTLAKDLNNSLQAELRKFSSPEECIRNSSICRDLVEERYRRLMMAMTLDTSMRSKWSLNFEVIRYVQLLDQWFDYYASKRERSRFSTSYLRESYINLFETAISTYEPGEMDLLRDDIVEFVDSFDAFGYSNQNSSVFRRGIRRVFDLAVSCCLYVDGVDGKKELSASFKNMMRASQVGEESEDGKGGEEVLDSFYKIVLKVQYGGRPEGEGKKSDSSAISIMDLMGMSALLIAQLENIESPFYDEKFYIVDRLFNKHIDSSQAEVLLQSIAEERSPDQILETAKIFTQVKILNMIRRTNQFMSDIYNSPNMSSEKVFERAVTESRALTESWHALLASLSILDNFLGSQFRQGSSQQQSAYRQTHAYFQAINRNVHYLAVYPNMIALTYYLSQLQGQIKFMTWWGREISIAGDTILDLFFSGRISQVWFRFGTDIELLSREMILYAFYYSLTTGTIDTLTNSQGREGDGYQDYFGLIFSKYLGVSQERLERGFRSIQSQLLLGNRSRQFFQVCEYERAAERGEAPEQPPTITMHFNDIEKFTYTGVHNESLSRTPWSFLSGRNSNAPSQLNGILRILSREVADRLAYAQNIFNILEEYLIRKGVIQSQGAGHPALDELRKIMTSLSDLRAEILGFAHTYVDYVYECYVLLEKVEVARQTRLYEEERQHLIFVHGLLAELAELQNAGDEEAFDIRLAEINNEFFGETSVRPGRVVPRNLDRIEGLTYVRSKYELYSRMRDHIVDDVFSKSPSGIGSLGPGVPQDTVSRKVVVTEPAGMLRNSMVENQVSEDIAYNPNQHEFVRTGMARLSGRTGDDIKWRDFLASGGEIHLNYLSVLSTLYLLGEVDVIWPERICDPEEDENFCREKVSISPEKMVQAYNFVVESLALSESELYAYIGFELEGRYKLNLFEDFLVEKTNMGAFPILWYLQKIVYEEAQLDHRTGSGVVGNAEAFARSINNLGVFIFEPGEIVKESIRSVYGMEANRGMIQVYNLNKYIQSLERVENLNLRQELQALEDVPFALRGNQVISLSSSLRGSQRQVALADRQRIRNFNTFYSQFVLATNDFYGTLNAVGAPLIRSNLPTEESPGHPPVESEAEAPVIEAEE